jgi:formylglycine-generating enzyme required for sulfatase activity
MVAIYGFRWRLTNVFGVIIVLAFANCAPSEVQEDAAPKSAAAVTAKTKRDAAVEKAQGSFDATKASTDKQYLADLSNALKLAMKAGNLDEAKRIDVRRSRIESGEPEDDGKESQPLKTIGATAAKTRHDAAWKKAEADLRSARILADKQYRSDLTAPIREAMKVADLEEAKRLDAASKAVDSEITELEHGGALGHPNAASYANTNTLGIRFVRIERGEFDMGSPAAEHRRDDEAIHHVKITKPFMMATTTVTQAQWKAVMGKNPSHFQGDERPVEQVSWNDAVTFCEKLGAKEGKHYRLPTEAEWEYSCRAGTQTTYGGTNHLEEMGWYKDNSYGQTHPVAQKKPNAWGLYDMHGNLWQWCADWEGAYPAGPATDPTGPMQGARRVVRGGTWNDDAATCRSASRSGFAPDDRSSYCGFRVVLDSP